MPLIRGFLKNLGKDVFRFLAILLLLTPVAVTSCDPETPPPYHQFIIRGEVEREGGGSREKFTVVCLVKPMWGGVDGTDSFQVYDPDAEYWRSPESIHVALTDEKGTFWLRIKTRTEIESLTAAVLLADQTFVTGDTLGVTDLPVTTDTYWETRSGFFGCYGFAPLELDVAGYVYDVPKQKIMIPWEL